MDPTNNPKVLRWNTLPLKRERWKVSGLRRVGMCMRRPLPADGGRVRAAIMVSGTGRARFTGLQRCGSVWACPECAELVARARIDELTAGVETARRRGGGVGFSWPAVLAHAQPARRTGGPGAGGIDF